MKAYRIKARVEQIMRRASHGRGDRIPAATTPSRTAVRRNRCCAVIDGEYDQTSSTTKANTASSDAPTSAQSASVNRRQPGSMAGAMGVAFDVAFWLSFVALGLSFLGLVRFQDATAFCTLVYAVASAVRRITILVTSSIRRKV